MERQARSSAIVMAALFFLGGLLGWIGGSYITPVERTRQTAGLIPGVGGGPEEAEEVVPYTTTVSDFRVQLNSLMKEHGVIASEYLQGLHDGKDSASLKTQLSQNSELIAGIIGEMFGNEAKGEFKNLWDTHIVHYERYTQASKSGNSEMKNAERDALLSHSQKMGEAMQRIDRNFSQARISDMMSEHIRLTLAIIDAYSDDNTALMSTNMKRAYDQAGEFADYLGQAIAASNPQSLQ